MASFLYLTRTASVSSAVNIVDVLMLGFVSISDLAVLVRKNLQNIPRDIDLIVGVPRSGMIPAYLIGLYVNRLVTDLTSFIDNKAPGHGMWRSVGVGLATPHEARSILLVDDSYLSGAAMGDAVRRIHGAGYRGRVVTCAAIVVPSMTEQIDLHFLRMPMPRVFEWNVLHHSIVQNSCFDLDGLLCVDPTDDENDDGPNYEKFLQTARPLLRPSGKIGHVVSARLEKYRKQTEGWLASNKIEYECLHLIDLPSAAERRRLSVHHVHKAEVYKATNSALFFESEPDQSHKIARLAAKPVLCTTNMTMYYGSVFDPRSSIAMSKWHLRKPLGWLKARLRRRLGYKVSA